MHCKSMEVGNEHADLWEDLSIIYRRVEGPEDVTVGDHPALGLCVVSHYGLEDRIEWFTQRAIPSQKQSETNRHTTPLAFEIDMLFLGGPATSKGHPV